MAHLVKQAEVRQHIPGLSISGHSMSGLARPTRHRPNITGDIVARSNLPRASLFRLPREQCTVSLSAMDDKRIAMISEGPYGHSILYSDGTTEPVPADDAEPPPLNGHFGSEGCWVHRSVIL